MVASYDTLARALAAEPDVRLAVLFGSEARGVAGVTSDLDVAIAGPDARELSSLALSSRAPRDARSI